MPTPKEQKSAYILMNPGVTVKLAAQLRMGGRWKKCWCFGCHRGRNFMPCKEWVGVTIVRQDKIGGLASSQQGGKRP